jgi:hypothetical protein
MLCGVSPVTHIIELFTHLPANQPCFHPLSLVASSCVLCHIGCWWCICIRIINFQLCLLAPRPVMDTPWLTRSFSRLTDWTVYSCKYELQWPMSALGQIFSLWNKQEPGPDKAVNSSVFVRSWVKKWTGEETERHEENNHFICYCCFHCFTCGKEDIISCNSV